MNKRFSFFFACFLVLAALVACGGTNSLRDENDFVKEVNYGTMTDSRDGQIYKTVKIGKQVWMAENLNYRKEIGGEKISYASQRDRDDQAYFKLARRYAFGTWLDDPTSFCYGDDSTNCSKYGRLFTWIVANKVCPEGWHLPSRAEWDTLIDFVGGKELAGKILKSSNSWFGKGNGTDDYGFSALPAGHRYVTDEFTRDLFNNEKRYATFWSSTEHDSADAYIASLSYYRNSADWVHDYKNLGLSVRCVMNELSPFSTQSGKSKQPETARISNSNLFVTDSRDGQIYRIVNIGGQIWMAENMNYKTEKSYCYENHVSYCSKYGRLYTKDAAQQACPAGWHLPTECEWKTLALHVREDIESLMSKNWNSMGCSGTDDWNFAMLPAGLENTYGSFENEGKEAVFWTSGGIVDVEHRSTECCGFYSHLRMNYKINFYTMNFSSGYFDSPHVPLSENAFSVRCIKDDSLKTDSNKECESGRDYFASHAPCSCPLLPELEELIE